MKDLEEKAGLLSRSAFPLLHLFGLQHVGGGWVQSRELELGHGGLEDLQATWELVGMVCGMGDLQCMDSRGIAKRKKIKAMGWKRRCAGVSGLRKCSNNLQRIGQVTVCVWCSGGKVSEVLWVRPQGMESEWEFPSPWKYFLLLPPNPGTLKNSQSHTPRCSWEVELEQGWMGFSPGFSAA